MRFVRPEIKIPMSGILPFFRRDPAVYLNLIAGVTGYKIGIV
jgi:hypothetical protein